VQYPVRNRANVCNEGLDLDAERIIDAGQEYYKSSMCEVLLAAWLCKGMISQSILVEWVEAEYALDLMTSLNLKPMPSH
jgi:hypothetical protein